MRKRACLVQCKFRRLGRRLFVYLDVLFYLVLVMYVSPSASLT